MHSASALQLLEVAINWLTWAAMFRQPALSEGVVTHAASSVVARAVRNRSRLIRLF
jgi:hypothetical protein